MAAPVAAPSLAASRSVSAARSAPRVYADSFTLAQYLLRWKEFAGTSLHDAAETVNKGGALPEQHAELLRLAFDQQVLGAAGYVELSQRNPPRTTNQTSALDDAKFWLAKQQHVDPIEKELTTPARALITMDVDRRGFILSPPHDTTLSGDWALQFGQSPLRAGLPQARLLFAQDHTWARLRGLIDTFTPAAARIADGQPIDEASFTNHTQRTGTIAIAVAIRVAHIRELAGQFVSRGAIEELAEQIDAKLSARDHARIAHMVRTALIVARICDNAGVVAPKNAAPSNTLFRKYVDALKTQQTNNVSQSQGNNVHNGAGVTNGSG